MSGVTWTQYFMEAQGQDIEENIMLQDNLSAMLLGKNGKQSRSKRTKHIRVRYIFIKDRVTCVILLSSTVPPPNRFKKRCLGSSDRKFKGYLLILLMLIWAGTMSKRARLPLQAHMSVLGQMTYQYVIRASHAEWRASRAGEPA
jgi:hypothetical protein